MSESTLIGNQLSMFESNLHMPLAARMRPRNLKEFFGQQHLVGESRVLSEAAKSGELHSMVLWGPPGTGKTTLAKILAKCAEAEVEVLSAVIAGVKDVRAAIDRAKYRQMVNQKSVLFIDEVHRFNKAQQDAFLPHIEDGTIIFIGATTENPSFELNNALLSRARVHVLKPLNDEDMQQILGRALIDRANGLGDIKLDFPQNQQQQLIKASAGDARRMLNWLESLVNMADEVAGKRNINVDAMRHVLGKAMPHCDKGGDIFYDLISALHKSIRGSDPDASLYWLCRMLAGGVDPFYVARRLIRVASEDIGNADPRALELTINAWNVLERLGSPEGELVLAQAVIYLACAPKSNAVYSAFDKAMKTAKATGVAEVPEHLRNAPTKLMKDLGFGKAYRYAHDEPHAYAAGENYLPEGMTANYYQPVDRGLEKKIAEKLKWLKSLDQQVVDQATSA